MSLLSAEMNSPKGMLKVGDRFPEFSVKAVVSANAEDAFKTITSKDFPGKWLVIFAWPKDFTFVCPTEIAGFNQLNGEFQDRDAQILGLSIDGEYAHLAWRQSHEDLKNLQFPMLADVKREITLQCGIMDTTEGVSQRALYIVDPEGIIRFCMMTDMSVGRSPKEVLRVLDALQTGGRCPCEWQPGDSTI
jgi:peroxiredoxin (alkyl hydroperoxide reductase subunit C)